MHTYKITNVTNLAGKRDSMYNRVVDIEYIDNRMKKLINLKAGDTVYLTVNSLPLSIHRLRMKGLILIDEVNQSEATKSTKKAVPKTVIDKPLKVAMDKPLKKSSSKKIIKTETK